MDNKKCKIIELNEKVENQKEIIKNLNNDKKLLNSNIIKIHKKSKKEKNKSKKDINFLQKKIKQIIDDNSDKSYLYEGKLSEEFYDVIIKINSIKYLDEGWEILMNERGKNNYEKYKNIEKIVRIGVIGNENKGKSTILKRISGFDLPTGYSIKTEGLSIKYPELEKYPNLHLVLLDSAGRETPVLNNNKNDLDNNNNIIFMEKSRDKLLTEVFLQNYIIKNSDILLLVFGKLTFEEQKLLNKVKNDMKSLKRKEPLIVIHNLKEFERISQIEEYIQTVLLRSSTFKLKEDSKINTDSNKSEWKFYHEENSYPKIIHLIYAKENSEADKMYNKGAIEMILNQCNNITDKKPFDIIESIKETFCDVSESILEKPLKAEDITDSDNKIIKLSNKEREIKLKRCLIDELGLSNFLSSGFEPKYDYYVDEDKLIIKIETPGEYKKNESKVSIESEGVYTFINISGIKLEENKKNENDKIIYLGKNRDYGEFNIRIKLEGYNLQDNKPNTSERDIKGITTITFNLKTGTIVHAIDL